MSHSFKIIDRFNLMGRGIVYTLKPNKNVNLKIGDSLFDISENEFKIIGIDFPSKCWNYMSPEEELPIGISVELISGVEAEGDVLIFKEET